MRIYDKVAKCSFPVFSIEPLSYSKPCQEENVILYLHLFPSVAEKSCRKFSVCAFSMRRHPSHHLIRVSRTPPCWLSYDFSGSCFHLPQCTVSIEDSAVHHCTASLRCLQMLIRFNCPTLPLMWHNGIVTFYLFSLLGNVKMSLNKECLLCRRVAGNSWCSWSN